MCSVEVDMSCNFGQILDFDLRTQEIASFWPQYSIFSGEGPPYPSVLQTGFIASNKNSLDTKELAWFGPYFQNSSGEGTLNSTGANTGPQILDQVPLCIHTDQGNKSALYCSGMAQNAPFGGQIFQNFRGSTPRPPKHKDITLNFHLDANLIGQHMCERCL